MATNEIRTFDRPVILVGGGDIAWDLLAFTQEQKYPIIAVDGGADLLAEKGIKPDIIIGDLDSVSNVNDLQNESDIIKISEQQTADFEKALYSISAPLFLAFGFWGQRLDHSLSAFHAITKYRSEKRIILVDVVDLLFVPQGNASLSLEKGTRVSIQPLDKVTFEGSKGLRYPLEGLVMKTGSAIGISNQTTEDHVEITPLSEGKDNYAVILPNHTLSAVISSLD